MKYKLLNSRCKPHRAHNSDGGTDLKSSISITLSPQTSATIPLGITTEIPNGYVGLVLPRSGIGSRGLQLRNTVGVIDSEYRGEWVAKVKNMSENTPLIISEGDRIVQCLIVPISLKDWDEVPELEVTERGNGGFGHTGV